MNRELKRATEIVEHNGALINRVKAERNQLKSEVKAKAAVVTVLEERLKALKEKLTEHNKLASESKASMEAAEKRAHDAEAELLLRRNQIGDLEAEAARLSTLLREHQSGEDARVEEASRQAVQNCKANFRPQLLGLLGTVVRELGEKLPEFNARSLTTLQLYFGALDRQTKAVAQLGTSGTREDASEPTASGGDQTNVEAPQPEGPPGGLL